jgi:hypothetical protein
MKNPVTKSFTAFIAVCAATFALSSCGITAEDILKKYEAQEEVEAAANKAGVSMELQATGDVLISYACPLLNESEENAQKLLERWFVADAEKPEVKLPAEMELEVAAVDTTNSEAGVARLIIKVGTIAERFLIIGFEGIAPTESTEADTPPLFFLVENKQAEGQILTPTPKLTGDLFPITYQPAFFSEQEYSGEIPFNKSKNVTLHLTLSADLKTLKQLTMKTEKLYLIPANFDNKRKNSKGESIYKYLGNSSMQTNFGIENVGGYNVLSGEISNLQFRGGFETTSPIDIPEGKITLNERPVICDLTVANACIYGTIKVEMGGSGTNSPYVVLTNTTTPQPIPAGILKEENNNQ